MGVLISHPDVIELLEEYYELFEPPQGLPTTRDFDHKITLKEGANPVNIRPYRHSSS